MNYLFLSSLISIRLFAALTNCFMTLKSGFERIEHTRSHFHFFLVHSARFFACCSFFFKWFFDRRIINTQLSGIDKKQRFWEPNNAFQAKSWLKFSFILLTLAFSSKIFICGQLSRLLVTNRFGNALLRIYALKATVRFVRFFCCLKIYT